jgi:hypothetical protein
MAKNPIQPVDREQRTVQLLKQEHEFRLTYRQGEETAVLSALADWVANPDLPFDWFDAAVMSHQLGEHLAKELQGFVPKKPA